MEKQEHITEMNKDGGTKMFKPYVAVNADGKVRLFSSKPEREGGWDWYSDDDSVALSKAAEYKLLRTHLTWKDEPMEVD